MNSSRFALKVSPFCKGDYVEFLEMKTGIFTRVPWYNTGRVTEVDIRRRRCKVSYTTSMGKHKTKWRSNTDCKMVVTVEQADSGAEIPSGMHK